MGKNEVNLKQLSVIDNYNVTVYYVLTFLYIPQYGTMMFQVHPIWGLLMH